MLKTPSIINTSHNQMKISKENIYEERYKTKPELKQFENNFSTTKKSNWTSNSTTDRKVSNSYVLSKNSNSFDWNFIHRGLDFFHFVKDWPKNQGIICNCPQKCWNMRCNKNIWNRRDCGVWSFEKFSSQKINILIQRSSQ